jgi:hypothetical protein
MTCAVPAGGGAPRPSTLPITPGGRCCRPLQSEVIVILAALEPDDRPGLRAAGPAEALDAVVAVLEYQLLAPVGNDHWCGLPALLGELIHGFDAIIPVLLGDRAQHRVAGRAGQAVQMVQRQPDRAGPPAKIGAKLLGQRRVVAARTSQESSHPASQLATFGRRPGALDGVLGIVDHPLLLPSHGRSTQEG